MSTLLIRGISQLVTCDDGDRILKGVDLFCEDGFIRQIGAHLDVSADEVIDAALAATPSAPTGNAATDRTETR